MADSTTSITQLGRKLRDPTNFAHSSAVLTRFLDHAQRLVNYHYSLIINTTAFTPSANRTLYLNSAVSANIARIEMIRQNDRNLIEVPWHSLVHNDTNWYRAVGQRYDLFARIGNDMFVLYPALAVPQSVDVVYTRNTAALTGAPGDITIPDEYVPVLEDLVEVLALLRGRKLPEAMNLAGTVIEAFTNQGHESIETQGMP